MSVDLTEATVYLCARSNRATHWLKDTESGVVYTAWGPHGCRIFTTNPRVIGSEVLCGPCAGGEA